MTQIDNRQFDATAAFTEALAGFSFTAANPEIGFAPVPDPGSAILVETGELVFS